MAETIKGSEQNQSPGAARNPNDKALLRDPKAPANAPVNLGPGYAPQVGPLSKNPPNPNNPQMEPGKPLEPPVASLAENVDVERNRERAYKAPPKTELKTAQVAEQKIETTFRPLRPGEGQPVKGQSFTYVGDEESNVAYGITFKRGEAVEVTDPFVIGKLSNNAHFTDGSDKDRLKEAQRLNQEADRLRGEKEARDKADADRLRNQRA